MELTLRQSCNAVAAAFCAVAAGHALHAHNTQGLVTCAILAGANMLFAFVGGRSPSRH